MRLNKLLLFPLAAFMLVGCTPLTDASGSGNGGGSLKTYGFGDTVKVGDFEYTVNSASNTTHVGSAYLGDDTENNFVIVNITVKNVGSSENNLLTKMMIYHVGNSEYEPHSSGIYLDNGFYVLQSIGAGLIKTVNVLYETPSQYTASDYLQVKASSYSSKSANIYMK